MKRNSIQCQDCGIFVSLSNIHRHKDSKTCKVIQKNGLYKKINVPKNLICWHCSKECKNDNSFRNHERTCSKNPNRQKTYFVLHGESAVKRRLIPTNQFIKAKQLGLDKPEIKEDTREKHRRAYYRNKRLSYSSKECEQFIQRLLSDLPELHKHRLYYYKHPHEFVLNLSDGSKVCYDFTIKNLNIIIEYNGAKFHPKSIDDSNFKPIFESQGSVRDCWRRDQEKLRLANDNGFDVLICWSDNVENDYAKILETLKTKVYNHIS